MEKIKFSYNWNNKLQCYAFTTLRLSNDNKYKVGQLYMILNKDQFVKYARVVEKKKLKLESINEFIARLDTGYSREKCIELIQTMYKNKGIDWSTQLLDLCLFVTEESK